MYNKSSVNTTRMCKKAYRRAERKLGVNMKKLQCVANLVTIHKKSLPEHKLTKKSGPYFFSREVLHIFIKEIRLF